MKSFSCSVIDKQETISPHGDNYCKQVTPEFLPSMAVPGISTQQQDNDNVVKPRSTDSVINLDNILQDCNNQVMKIRGSSKFPARIHQILKNNQILMSSYLKVFQNKFGLKKKISQARIQHSRSR